MVDVGVELVGAAQVLLVLLAHLGGGGLPVSCLRLEALGLGGLPVRLRSCLRGLGLGLLGAGLVLLQAGRLCGSLLPQLVGPDAVALLFLRPASTAATTTASSTSAMTIHNQVDDSMFPPRIWPEVPAAVPHKPAGVTRSSSRVEHASARRKDPACPAVPPP